jgi:hypothetical protein
MKFLKKIAQRKQKKTRTMDMYQNVVEQFGRDQLLRLAEKGLSISLGAV